MNIVFCWSTISGYMAACWRELAGRPGVNLFVIAHRSGGQTAFQDDLLRGIPHRLLDASERNDAALIESLVAGQKPDVVAITGWWLKAYRALTRSAALRRTKFVMGVDSPWRSELQYLTRWRYQGYFKELDHVFVAGERSWQYVRRLGFPPESISRGMYGIDFDCWEAIARRRTAAEWPRSFLFLGRYSHEKAVDVLVSAYQDYRRQVETPWPLLCCGRGPDEALLAGQPGIENLGFVQPDALPEVFRRAGVFVLPSRFDPWPLALVEAAATGLPILCSEACGSSVENVRPFYNGLIVPPGSVAALSRAVRQMHLRHGQLPEWGARSIEFARAYSAAAWTDRWFAIFTLLCNQ